MAVHPKHLLIGPPVIWSLIGLVALLAPGEVTRLFPLLWAMNDAALALAFLGLILWAFRRPGPEGPPAPREWQVDAPPELARMPLEAVLRVLAARARRER